MLEPYLRAEFVPENLPTPASFLFALSNAGRGCRRRSRHSAAHERVATQCAHAGTLARAVLSKQLRESRVPSSCPYNPCAQDLLEWCCCSLSSWRPDHRGTTIRSPRLAYEVLQNLQRLPRERHNVRRPHLHSLCRNIPTCSFRVELFPARANQLSCSQKGQRHQLDRQSCDMSARVNLDLPEEMG